MVAIKDGQTANGDKFRSYVCSNRESGCDFFETKYGDLTPPGILITEEMTAQDIEKLRETRRNNRIHRLPQAPQTPMVRKHLFIGTRPLAALQHHLHHHLSAVGQKIYVMMICHSNMLFELYSHLKYEKVICRIIAVAISIVYPTKL